ncbi:MAG: exodeoxyribonuclease VII small subunit [Clostridiales bacterium]|nr:exodeoxyribonuclease VII small subunit [Clostridiales bacterium]
MSSKLSFEKAMEMLEEIVGSLEKGNLNLEDSLKAYQEGVKLSEYCNKILEDAEGKISMIMKENNSYKETDFLGEEL